MYEFRLGSTFTCLQNAFPGKFQVGQPCLIGWKNSNGEDHAKLIPFVAWLTNYDEIHIILVIGMTATQTILYAPLVAKNVVGCITFNRVSKIRRRRRVDWCLGNRECYHEGC